MKMKRFFEKPTQVRFRDPEGDNSWIGGIAYQDKIICGECGEVLNVEDYDYFNFQEYDHWVSISEEIKGED